MSKFRADRFNLLGEERLVVRPIAELITAMALRECAPLDDLWIRRTRSTCEPQIKRRHRQFLSELLAFYCCVAQAYIAFEVDDDVTWLANRLALEVSQLATNDHVLNSPPFFLSDDPERAMHRYHRHIRKTLLESNVASGSWSFLRFAAPAARELGAVMKSNQWTSIELGDFQQTVRQRLMWTAHELTGRPRPRNGWGYRLRM